MTAPPRLDHEALARAHAATLSAPRRRYALPARALFVGLDAFYGRRRTLEKFRVLELIARVPYQAWEQAAYVATTHVHEQGALARRIHDRVLEVTAAEGDGLTVYCRHDSLLSWLSSRSRGLRSRGSSWRCFVSTA